MASPFRPGLPPRLALLMVLAGCAVPPTPHRSSSHADSLLPRLEEAVLVYDTAASRPEDFGSMLDALATHDVVFVGETHLDDTTHRVELAVYEGLLERTGGRVVLSMEMFERDVQPVLDDYLARRIDEQEFLANARPWGNYRTGYRAMIELARERGLPVVAANTPISVRRSVAFGGADAFAKLSAEQRALLPDEILPTSAAYWERVDRAVRGHMGPSGGGDPDARRFSTQSLWDNSMGAACAEALERHPGWTVLHVVGGFHVAYHQGTVEQLRARAPNASVAVVSVSPTGDLHSPRPERNLERADWLVYALSTARGPQGGEHAVIVPSELRYELHVPEGPHEEDLPLLVWLPDEGQRVEDAVALWRAMLEDEFALAVVHAPYQETSPDLVKAGVWWQADSFREDNGRVASGLARIAEYVARHYPVDANHVVVGGEGAGAIPVLWAAMYGSWLDASFVAVEPRGVRKLRMQGLPDRAPAARRLEVLVAAEDAAGIEQLVADYREVGVPECEVQELEAGWDRAELAKHTVRQAGTGRGWGWNSTAVHVLVFDATSPRARQWADLHAKTHEGRRLAGAMVVAAEDLDETVNTPWGRRHADVYFLRFGGEAPQGLDGVPVHEPWQPADLASGVGIPLAPGDFGGTTVLVVPAGTPADECEAWRALEEGQALKKRSRFASLRVAFAEGEPSLADTLEAIRASGRSNVLVVPAMFCADAEHMQALRKSAGSLERLDVAWLPGLGAEAVNLWPAGEKRRRR